jgi:hypothetical protein
MKTRITLAILAATMTVAAHAYNAKQAFGMNAPLVSGFPGGRSAEITGGGAYDLPSNFAHAGGGFRCLSDIQAGPFNGCLAGQGVRWDTAGLLASSPFQCTGSDAIKTATTNDSTVVLMADFYRQGDGDIESFTAKMIVSATDLDPVTPGIQHVWIQGIGCGESIANFN